MARCVRRKIAIRFFLSSVRLIAQHVSRFRSRQVVLVHGRSRVVTSVLKHAKQQGKSFSVIVTEGRPHGQGCVLVGLAFFYPPLFDLRVRMCSCCVFLPPGTERPKS